MKFARAASKLALSIAGLLIFASILAQSQQHATTRAARSSANRQNAQQIFSTTCAACHGLDGMGSERAPNIITNPQVQKLTAAEMFGVISGGVPGTGMPAFERLGKSAITSLVAYVKSLQGKNQAAPLPGDPNKGEALFSGSGQCSTCHMAGGHGGFIAPDLSAYGQTHSADEIRSAITNPAARNSAKTMVTAIASNGDRYQGIIRNEDNFSLQLQSTDGAFHFLNKAGLKTIDRGQTSIMPSDYSSRLNETELNDIVSYLLDLSNNSSAVRPVAPPHPDNDE
ncbi:MAG TPA: c-type cytochrome [Terriglobales bacterium]|jgi:putative heme-binding domain-containing protein|nr:c-type cytochrome [Terriglobales bacterium]